MALSPPVFFCFIRALHQSLWSFPSFLAWASLRCNFICSVLWLRQHHPTQIRFHSPSYLALFLQGAHVWAYVRPTWLAGVFFSPTAISLSHVCKHCYAHSVCSVQLWAGQHLYFQQQCQQVDELTGSLTFNGLLSFRLFRVTQISTSVLFRTWRFLLTCVMSHFDYVSMTFVRNFIWKWVNQYIGHQ